jgi:hypothetical protein
MCRTILVWFYFRVASYLLHTLHSSAEADFLDVFGTKVVRVFLLAIHSHSYLYLRILLQPTPPLSKSGLKLTSTGTYGMICSLIRLQDIKLETDRIWFTF